MKKIYFPSYYLNHQHTQKVENVQADICQIVGEYGFNVSFVKTDFITLMRQKKGSLHCLGKVLQRSN